MKLLCKFTPSGDSLQRISTEDYALEYQWYSYVKSFASFTIACHQHGGFAKPIFTDLELWPDMFENLTWPPASSATVELYRTDGDVSDGTSIFDGVASLSKFDRNSVRYVLKMAEHDYKVASSTAFSDTLVNVVTDLCGVSKLNLSLDSSSSRSPSPAVSYTTTSDVQAIDLLDDMCKWFCHGFKIIDGTLYLYDMLDNNTTEDLDEFDIQAASYRRAEPISLYSSGDRSIAGSGTNGKEYNLSTAYHSTGSNIDDALGDIKTMMEKQIATIPSMFNQHTVGVLDDLSLVDESTIQDTNTTAKAISIVYNFNSYQTTIKAVGAIT